jgi:nicotinamidase-related amidase
MASWDDLLSPSDRAVIEAAGYNTRGAVAWGSRAMGRRPAVLVVDMEYQCVGRDVPILEAVKEWRTAVGQLGWTAAGHIAPLLSAARDRGIPIIHTHSFMHNDSAAEREAVKFIEPLTPQDGDIVVEKDYASAFYGTAVLRHLIRHNVDTLVITGTTTSGCIRASAVDAQEHGFNVVIPEECVFDRLDVSHKVSLLDIWMKYGLVMPVADVHAYFDSLPQVGAGT